MLTLCIDTAYRYLTCVLIDDDKIIASFSEECFKKQSEYVFKALEKIFDEANIDQKSIDALCITKGPGSYTGVRIAMTIAKTIGQIMNKKVYTISTLRLYAGNKKNTMVIMDARSKRAYVGVYDEGNVIMNDCVMPCDEIDAKNYDVVLDGDLIGKDKKEIDIPRAFLDTRKYWDEVKDIPHLVPEYLKETEQIV